MALPEVGVRAVVENLPAFKSATDAMGKSVQDMGLKFDQASGRWRTAAGQFANGAQLAAAGIGSAGKAADNTKVSFTNLGGITTKVGSVAL